MMHLLRLILNRGERDTNSASSTLGEVKYTKLESALAPFVDENQELLKADLKREAERLERLRYSQPSVETAAVDHEPARSTDVLEQAKAKREEIARRCFNCGNIDGDVCRFCDADIAD